MLIFASIAIREKRKGKIPEAFVPSIRGYDAGLMGLRDLGKEGGGSWVES